MGEQDTDWKAVGAAMAGLAESAAIAAMEVIAFILEAQRGPLHTPPRVRNYPSISTFQSGFPHIVTAHNAATVPIDYEAYLTGRPSLLSFPLSEVPPEKVPALNDIREAFAVLDGFSPYVFDDDDFTWRAKSLAQKVAVRYLQTYGQKELKKDNLLKVVWPLIEQYAGASLTVHIAVPIALTRFDLDYFSLDERHKVVRIPDAYQKARSQLFSIGSGVESCVAEAATHAFLAKNWGFLPTGDTGVSEVVSSFPVEASDLVDRFFAALRLATGITTGYAQVLYVHRRWASYPKWDLPSVSGRYFRRYPSQFDHHGWIKTDLPTVTRDDLKKLREYFISIEHDNHKKIKYSLRRLSSAIARDDDDDAILDAMIGLELLLGDGSDALSYKLRMRAAALAKLTGAEHNPDDLMSEIKALYNVRSKIVHEGVNPRKANRTHQLSNDHPEPSPERQSAIRILRFVLDSLIKHPQFRDPKKIDNSILT